MTQIQNVTISKNFNLVNYLLKILSHSGIQKFKLNVSTNDITIYTTNSYLKFLLNFLKNHHNLQFKTLITITAIDYPNDKQRFKVNYFLLSYKLNSRLRIQIETNDINPIDSITSIYSGAGWYEREVWDMFGIFFLNHPDLRRILTDYGFEGFPFRKDFPQTGFLEVRYDDEKKYVIYEPLELAQEFRSFDFTTPWLNSK